MCLGCDVSTKVSDIDYALVINFILLGHSITKCGLWEISFLLVDLRDDKQFFADHPGAVPITTSQGEELRKLIGAPVYIECSSKTQQNVKAVFDAAIKVVLQPPKSKKKKKRKAQKACSILWLLKTRVLWRKRDQLIILNLTLDAFLVSSCLMAEAEVYSLNWLSEWLCRSIILRVSDLVGCVSTCILMIYILSVNVQHLVPYDVSTRMQEISFYEENKLVQLVSCFIIKRWFSSTS